MMNWLRRLLAPKQQAESVSPAPPEVGSVKFGEMAESFRKSEHFVFFKMLCARIRDENLIPTTDKDAAALHHGIAAAMSQLPFTVDRAIMQKDAILAARAKKQQKALVDSFAGNGRRQVSRPFAA